MIQEPVLSERLKTGLFLLSGRLRGSTTGSHEKRICYLGSAWYNFVILNCRGGVEDTRLEAKAKDTKNIRGQGQEPTLRGQTLSRPRTGMLEPEAKDTTRKCSKKKVFAQKIANSTQNFRPKKRS